MHGSGAVVFDTKAEEVTDSSGIEVFYHHVRLVRGGDVIETPAGDPTTVKEDRVVVFDEPETVTAGGPDFTPGVEYLATIDIIVTSEELTTIVAGPPAPSAAELVANFDAAGIVITELEAEALLGTLGLEEEVSEVVE